MVSTYYHVLIAALKQLARKRCADVLCTDFIPGVEELIPRLVESQLFEHVIYIADVREYELADKAELIYGFHKKNIASIEESFPTGFRFENYEEINLFHDDIWPAHYLKSKRMNYRLVEDALDSYTYLSKTRYSYLLPRKGPRAHFRDLAKRVFHIGYLFLGRDGLAYEIEVNRKSGVEFASKKLVEIPRKSLFGALDADNIYLLKRLFSCDNVPNMPSGGVLFLTQPLWADGYLNGERAQGALYQYLVKRDLGDQPLVIKPHPRDFTDYRKFFPNALILEKNMPAELLSYVLPISNTMWTPFQIDDALQKIFLHPPKLGGYFRLCQKERST